MQAHRKARTAAAVTIEGEAVVLERHAGTAQPAPHRPEEPINDNRPHAALPLPSRRPQPRPDLVFPGRVRWPSTPRPRPVGPTALRRIGPVVAAAGTAAAVLGIAAFVLATRLGAPVPAESARFELTETQSTISAHRDGAILAVEGRIRNVSARAGTPPEISVRLGDADGGSLSRSFRPGASVLRPGASLFFHSTLALPSATSGEIAVSLARMAEGKSMPR